MKKIITLIVLLQLISCNEIRLSFVVKKNGIHNVYSNYEIFKTSSFKILKQKKWKLVKAGTLLYYVENSKGDLFYNINKVPRTYVRVNEYHEKMLHYLKKKYKIISFKRKKIKYGKKRNMYFMIVSLKKKNNIKYNFYNLVGDDGVNVYAFSQMSYLGTGDEKMFWVITKSFEFQNKNIYESLI